MTPKTMIFIPTYNEHANVRAMCERIVALGLDADLVFMDDASPDGTGRMLDRLADLHPRVSVIHRTGKSGIGSAHVDGIGLAYTRGYDRLVTLDCDFAHSPEQIPMFLAALDSADVVVGSRYMKSGSLPGWTPARRALTNVGHALTRVLLDLPYDATGAFRAYNLRTVSRDVFSVVGSRGYAFFFESLFAIHDNGYTIAEVPIRLPARTYGSSKMSVAEIRRSVMTLGRVALEQQRNPMRSQIPRSPLQIDPNLGDPQRWDEYWEEKKGAASTYGAVASAYRNAVIRPRLEATIRREFDPGASLLHAGCGSGQVDTGLHAHADITAVDISPAALRMYRQENPRVKDVRHASIMALPFADETFDGAYNLGVVEHFSRDELRVVLTEIRRTLRKGGKLVIFWPHAYATSVAVLGVTHVVLNDVLRRQVRLHPPEHSLIHSEKEARAILGECGLDVASYTFGPRDFFVQAVVVAVRRD